MNKNKWNIMKIKEDRMTEWKMNFGKSKRMKEK